MPHATPHFITLEQAQSLSTRAFIDAAVESLRARHTSLGAPDEIIQRNAVRFTEQAEQYTKEGVRASFIRYVAPSIVALFGLKALAPGAMLSSAASLVFLSVILFVILRSSLRLAAGPQAIHAHYKEVWDSLEASTSSTTPQ